MKFMTIRVSSRTVPTRSLLTLGAILLISGSIAIAQDEHSKEEREKHGEQKDLTITFSAEPAPMKLNEVPDRPSPILELGDPFLGTGPLQESFEIPTGAVWSPSFLVFGSVRTAMQTFDDGDETFSEWVTRLDLFGNLQLSATERVLIGLRPFDENGEFTGYFFEPNDADQVGWDDGFNGRITHLFFEGDFGELFPGLDPDDSGELDLGFSVGRQPFFYQEGLLINDRIDAVGITKNDILVPGLANLQITGVYGWNEINRGDNIEDDSAHLFGLFAEADTEKSTINFDGVYVYGDENGDNTDAMYLAASAVQRIGRFSTAFRALTSLPFNGESAAVGQGELLFTEISWSPHHSEDIVYVNGFWGIDEFTSAAREIDEGGPLGRTGLLYAAVGMGRYGAPLGNDPARSVGASLGYQHFFNENRSQIVAEVGGRTDTDDSDDSAVAVAGRFETAIGQHTILRLDGFIAGREHAFRSSGLRMEFVVKF